MVCGRLQDLGFYVSFTGSSLSDLQAIKNNENINLSDTGHQRPTKA